MTNKFEDPTELKEYARREIKDGEIVLKAAGLGKVNRVSVEVERDGHSELVPIPVQGDAFDAAWKTYANHSADGQHHETA